MSLHVFTGLPGSGKSSRLIERVNSAIARQQTVATFVCNESPLLAERKEFRIHRRLACRRPGLTCPLHHFVSTVEAAEILARLPAGALAAFDEAQFFDPAIVKHWSEASQRGVEVLVSTPSPLQLRFLKGLGVTETTFRIQCQKCDKAEASTFVVLPETNGTLSLCGRCHEEMVEIARRDLLERLERQPPHPGEKAIYQPIDGLPECASWKIVRPDSKTRADLMSGVIREMKLPEVCAPSAATYLDIGCNTGYFCNRIRHLGFYAEGVDVVKGDIEVARILDAFFHRDRNHYVAQDAYTYLEETQDRLFDVTSAFAVFQWLMIQTTVERGITCLQRLFAKTRRLCFLEMGYSAEPQYKEALKVNIDRAWVRRVMEEEGGFSEVRMFDAQEHGLMFGRDFFVGIKQG